MNFFEGQLTSSSWEDAFALGAALSQAPSERRSIERNQEPS